MKTRKYDRRFIHVHLPVHDDLSEGLTLAIFNGGGGVGQKANVSIGGQ